MDLINRYIYAVTRHFPKKQKTEIEQELKANIEDMIEENESGESYEAKVEKVLLELGDPEIVADNYRGSSRFLIGPLYYDLYLMVVKIVIAAVVGGISIALFIKSFFTSNIDIVNIGVEYISSIFIGALQAFAWTTIVFIIIERNDTRLKGDLLEKGPWDLSKLPELPNKKAQIPISEPIAAIIFTTIFFSAFLGVLYSVPEVLAIFFEDAGEMIRIPIFDIVVLKGYRAFIIAIFILGILKEVSSLYYRKWNQRNALVHISIIILTAILGLIILTDKGLWNPNLTAELLKYVEVDFDFPALWFNIRNWIIGIFLFANVVEILSIIYKSFYLNKKR